MKHRVTSITMSGNPGAETYDVIATLLPEPSIIGEVVSNVPAMYYFAKGASFADATRVQSELSEASMTGVEPDMTDAKPVSGMPVQTLPRAGML